MQRHQQDLITHFLPFQRGVLHKNACETIIHELSDEYNDGNSVLTIDFTNAFNTPSRLALAKELYQNPIFRPFLRLFSLEYGTPSELLFFANDALHSTIQSSSGVRQGSALSSLYFCAFLHPCLTKLAAQATNVKVKAYIDDVTLSSKNSNDLMEAFFILRKLAKDIGLEINPKKCRFLQGKHTIEMPRSLLHAGIQETQGCVKVLGAFVGEKEDVRMNLIQSQNKHTCLFRRLKKMGPSNLSLAILSKSTNTRLGYLLRAHPPDTTFQIAESFDQKIDTILEHWLEVPKKILQPLCSLPWDLGGLGLTPSKLIQKHAYVQSRNIIEEQQVNPSAPVIQETAPLNDKELEEYGPDLDAENLKENPQSLKKTDVRQIIRHVQEKQFQEISQDPFYKELLQHTHQKGAFEHMCCLTGFVNPYLFRYALLLRLGLHPKEIPSSIPCPGCRNKQKSRDIFSHVVGCVQCVGSNATRKHSYLLRFLSDLCLQAGLPCVLEPRIFSSYRCSHCGAEVSPAHIDKHPCRKEKLIRSGPDIVIMAGSRRSVLRFNDCAFG